MTAIAPGGYASLPIFWLTKGAERKYTPDNSRTHQDQPPTALKAHLLMCKVTHRTTEPNTLLMVRIILDPKAIAKRSIPELKETEPLPQFNPKGPDKMRG